MGSHEVVAKDMGHDLQERRLTVATCARRLAELGPDRVDLAVTENRQADGEQLDRLLGLGLRRKGLDGNRPSEPPVPGGRARAR